MANFQLAESKYEETWLLFLSMVEKNPKLKASEFNDSVSVNMPGYKMWLSKQGYGKGFRENRSYALKLLKGQLQDDDDTQVIESEDMINEKNIMITNDYKEHSANATQYWWLNVDADVWNLSTAKNGSTKLIPYETFNKKTKIKVDKQFHEWISRYLVDREDNPHFGIPIAYQEFAISYLDYFIIPVNKKSLNRAKLLIRKNLDEYIKTTDLVCNPPVVLSAPSYSDKGRPQRAAWRYPIDAKNNSIKIDGHGNRLPRVLNTSAQCDCLYFYRKSEIPTHPYVNANKGKIDRHIGDKNYVQPAPDVDPDINFQIWDIQPISHVFPIKTGDIVIGCNGKNIVAFLDAISVGVEEVGLRVDNKLPHPYTISSFKKTDCDYTPEKKLGFFPITNTIFNSLSEIIDESMEYSKADLLKEAYIDETTIDSIYRALNYKKNIILQGAPGVGKTYLAKRISYAMMGLKDDERICVVQFHPNYTYEDFIIGYKPCDDGSFKLKPGIFMDFCRNAEKQINRDKKFFFIIDEINRGNLNKIFGEAFTLIDKDHRGEYMMLSNLGEEYNEFNIPKNVYIIGLMNTADKSLAMLDYALLRRFEFITLEPAFGTKPFEKYQKSINSELFNDVINSIIELNSDLGEGFYIGHSYFCISKKRDKAEYEECLKNIETWLKNVIEYEIIPILRAYWFDDEDTFKKHKNRLLEVFKHDKG